MDGERREECGKIAIRYAKILVDVRTGALRYMTTIDLHSRPLPHLVLKINLLLSPHQKMPYQGGT